MVQRGAKTRGKVARAIEGAQAIEIKATIPDRQIEPALQRFNLTPDLKEERFIFFFDTPRQDLLKAGIIARARREVGGVHDSTVKFRPVDPAAVDPQWRKYRDFKIEADASEKGTVKSASLTMPVERGLIKRVAAGHLPIPELFTREQRDFLLSMAAREINFEGLSVLGPLTAHRWRFEDPACPWPITAELWTREDGARLMEASIKAPAVQAAAAIGGFMAFLAEVGAEKDDQQQTKTRWAMDYYIAKIEAAAAPAVPAAATRRPAKAATAPSRRSAPGRRAIG